MERQVGVPRGIRQDEVLNRGSSTPTGVGTQPNGSVGTPHTAGLRSADDGTLSKEAHDSGNAPFSTWRGRRVEVGRGGRSSAGWAGPAHQQGRAASMGWAGAQQAGWCVLDYERVCSELNELFFSNILYLYERHIS